MQNKPISDLVAAFDQQSDRVRACLTDLLGTVGEGRVPSREAMSGLDSSVAELRTRYDAVYAMTRDTVSAGELPQDGAPVGELADAVENCRARYLDRQLKRAADILEKFTGVRSLIREYAAALAPYQAAAAALLDKLAEDTVEELFPRTQGPQLFLQAVETESMHSPAGTELMKKVQEHYPDMAITIGLATRQFYLDDQAAPETVLEAVPEEAPENAPEDVPEEIPAEAPPADEEVPEADGQEAAELLPIRNQVKTGAPGASTFRKEVERLRRSYPEVSVILPIFTNLGVMSKMHIFGMGVAMDCFLDDDAEERVGLAVDMLADKGYLAEFEADGTAWYCLPSYSWGCMQKESIRQDRRLLALSVGNARLFADTEISAGDARLLGIHNDVLLAYLLTQRASLSAPEYEKVKRSIRWCGDHYQAACYVDGAPQTAYLAVLSDDDRGEDGVIDARHIQAKYIVLAARREQLGTVLFHPACEKVIVTEGVRPYFCDPDGSLSQQMDQADAAREAAAEDAEPDAPEAEPEETGQEPEAASPAGEPEDIPADAPADTPAAPEAPEDTPAPAAEAQMEEPSGGLTPRALLERKRTPGDDEFCGLIHELLSTEVPEDQLTGAVVNAVLLARGAGLADDRPAARLLSAQVRLASMLMPEECSYSSECLARVFGGVEAELPALTLAAYMYALLTPAVTYDFGLKAQTEQFLWDFNDYFGELTAFKALFNQLMRVREVKVSGFTPAVIALLGNEAENERFRRTLCREANANLTVNTPKTRMKALPILYNSEFGIGSDLYQCMEIIAQGRNDGDALEWVETVLSEYCEAEDGEYRIAEHKVDDRLNRAWDDANPKTRFRLEYDARDLALRQYRQRLEIMARWVEHIRSGMGGRQELERLRVLRRDILALIADIREDRSWRGVKDTNILAWLLTHMESYLTDTLSDLRIYSDLLYTGVFSLSPGGVPEIDASLGNLKYYEVWRNALRHMIAPRRSLEEITAEILGETADGDAGLKDNLRQLSLLGQLAGTDDEVYAVSDAQAREAADYANIRTERFRDALELAYTYNQINETEKENLAGIMNQYKGAFYEIGDFAAWRRFLEALEEQIRELADGRKARLRSRLDGALARYGTSPLLQEAERLLEQESNFAVAEEYLNRAETGECELDDALLHDNDYFSDFLTPSVYDPLLQECIRSKGRNLKTFGWNYVEKQLPRDWTARLRDSSRALVSNWPARRDMASPAQVQGLLKGLGIDAGGAVKAMGRREEMWQVTVRPTARSLADYLHPIAAFGTQMKSPLQVIFLYGSHTPQQLVDTVTSLNLGTMSIVFIDQPIDAAARRYIGEIFHTQKTGQNPFLLVDQVLLLYLAMHQETERLPAMLKCTLPYTTYQPFVRDGGSTADEMFCGRATELATIIDPNGACVVYGGRQLGKTALLERAESRCSKPENKAYAVYSTIIRQKSEAEAVETLLADIKRKTEGKVALKPCGTLREMCAQLSRMFMTGQIVSMHLLIDEVDDFLGAIADEAYRPIQPLVDLKRETKNNFKFVIAGLHNVCRAKNATRANGIFGQLGRPLCIKPLSPTDAMQLLSKPLRYLGFRIDRYPHLETILTNTNYYPGILQFFGYILVETLTGQYAKYYRAADGNPPFTLRDDQLGAVMNSADLNKSIKDKFRWSLELDPRYFMIARCITMLYHIFEEDRASCSWRGFSVEDIMGVAEDYHIHCLENVSKTEYIILMDEMVEMGILGKPDESAHTYRLRRNSFVDIIGESLDSLEADIISNNTEE